MLRYRLILPFKFHCPPNGILFTILNSIPFIVEHTKLFKFGSETSQAIGIKHVQKQICSSQQRQTLLIPHFSGSFHFSSAQIQPCASNQVLDGIAYFQCIPRSSSRAFDEFGLWSVRAKIRSVLENLRTTLDLDALNCELETPDNWKRFQPSRNENVNWIKARENGGLLMFLINAPLFTTRTKDPAEQFKLIFFDGKLLSFF
jgi:hypothetical protein